MKEQKYYGIHACQALWKKRPQDVIRVYIDESNVKEFAPLLKWCAQNKKAYHIIPSTELDKVTDSVHHEGICILAKELKALTEREFISQLGKWGSKICLLYLDGVQNPHNIGSIVRTAAHFGIPFILGEKLPALSPAACRIAKGGAEIVRLVYLQNPLETLRSLKEKKFALIGTSSHKGTSLYQFPFPSQSIIAIGAESTGLGVPLQRLIAGSIKIPGTDSIESLNVSVASALCIGEYCRQHLV